MNRTISKDRRVADLIDEVGAYGGIFFTWLIAWLDKHGRYHGDPRILKGEVAPLIDGITHDVIEAVQLSNRIITLAHGGTVFDDIPIDLPFPRRASDPEFAAKQAEILGRFETMESEREASIG